MTEKQKILKRALFQENLVEAKEILDDNTNPNFITGGEFNKDYLIHQLAHKNLISSLKLILKYEAKVDPKNKRKETPLYSYCFHNKNSEKFNIEIPKLLLQYGANPNHSRVKSETSMLSDAVYRNKFDLVKLLVQKGADVNDNINSGGWVPLANPSSIDIVDYLLKNNADVNILEKSGHHIIFYYINPDTIERILETPDQTFDPGLQMFKAILSKSKLNEETMLAVLKYIIHKNQGDYIELVVQKGWLKPKFVKILKEEVRTFPHPIIKKHIN